MSIQPPPLATRFASLHTNIAACPNRGWLPRSLHALILAALARIFGRLEQLLLLWQAGTLPAPQSRHSERSEEPTLLLSPRQPNVTRTFRSARTRQSRARTPCAAQAIPAPTPSLSSAPQSAVKPALRPRPTHANRCPRHRQNAPSRGRPRTPILLRYQNK